MTQRESTHQDKVGNQYAIGGKNRRNALTHLRLACEHIEEAGALLVPGSHLEPLHEILRRLRNYLELEHMHDGDRWLLGQEYGE